MSAARVGVGQRAPGTARRAACGPARFGPAHFSRPRSPQGEKGRESVGRLTPLEQHLPVSPIGRGGRGPGLVAFLTPIGSACRLPDVLPKTAVSVLFNHESKDNIGVFKFRIICMNYEHGN